jgi:hypothetical protein
VVRELPVRVTRTSSPTRDTDTIEITESFTAAVNKIEGKLHDYAKANGAKVEEISSRLSATGTISRIWNRSSVAEWLRRTFPVHTFDVTREETDGAEKKVCQVRVAQGFFSPGITVTVTPYRGGAHEARTIERELEKQAPTAESTSHVTHQAGSAVERGNSPSRPAEVVLPDLTQTIEKRIASSHELQKRIAAQREEDRCALASRAKKLGLSPSAPKRDVEIIEKLRNDIARDLKALPEQARTGDIQLQRDGRVSVMTRSYTIDLPESVQRTSDWIDRRFSGRWDQSKDWDNKIEKICRLVGFWAAFGLTVTSSIPLILGAKMIFGAAMGCSGIFLGILLSVPIRLLPHACSRLQSKLAGLGFLRGPLRSREPGSLGDIVESLRGDGLECDIHVGERGKRDWRVNLEVTYKPKGKIS